MAQACLEPTDVQLGQLAADSSALQPYQSRPCVGAKRARDRLGLETCLEESVAEEVNVACGAVVPQLEPTGEASRRVTQPAGSSVWGSSGVSDQDMATPIASTEGALSFEVASLRAAASAAVAECTKLVDGSIDPAGRRNAARSAGNPLADRARGSPRTQRGVSRELEDLDLASSRSNSRESDTGSAASTGTGVQQSRGPRDPVKVSSDASSGSAPPQSPAQQCPPHGAKAICGRRPRMEDAYTAIPFLLEVLVPADVLGQSDILPPRIATQVKSASTSPSSSIDDCNDVEGEGKAAEPAAGGRRDSGVCASTAPHTVQDQPQKAHYMETLHFFGVFDGHGGAEGALHCAQTLHQRIVEALAQHTAPVGGHPDTNHDSSSIAAAMVTEADTEPAAGAAVGTEEATLVKIKSGQLPESVPLPKTGASAPHQQRVGSDVGDSESSSSESDAFMTAALEEEGAVAAGAKPEGIACSAQKFESALTDAFNRTDEEFGKADNAALVGTTAVVALVGSRQLYVANCGDSRAVLCRGGVAIALTDDHKAAREDETARVEAAGGQILFWNGVRVMGVLAVSRAIGDHCLRPFVIAQPEVTILGRRPDDELLLLASDGLWDVLSNQEACTLAKRCLRRARQRGASRQSAARIAATVLTRAAVDRGSRDNVTVVVVDLSTASAEADALARAPSAAAAVGGDDPNDDTLSSGPSPMARSRSSAAGALDTSHSYPEASRRL